MQINPDLNYSTLARENSVRGNKEKNDILS
jgi:hypothetical protein